MIKVQVNIFGREWEQVRCQWQCTAYDEYLQRLCETMLVDAHGRAGVAALPEALGNPPKHVVSLADHWKDIAFEQLEFVLPASDRKPPISLLHLL